jgi:hypothetical protein
MAEIFLWLGKNSKMNQQRILLNTFNGWMILHILKLPRMLSEYFAFDSKQLYLKKMIPICRQWNLDKDSAIELGYRVFERFRKYACSFDKAKCKKEIDTCVLFFLFRISQNLLSSFKKEITGEGLNPYTGEEEIIRNFPNLDEMNIQTEKLKELKRRQEIVEKALARLSPKHKIVYLTYKTHEKDNYKLPRKLLLSLREKLDLTQTTIRAYKNEAFEKIDTYLKIYGSK